MGGSWFEDEDFWVRFAPLMFDESGWAEVPGVVDSVLGLARGPKPPASVLDVCCGVGRHSIEFARRGYSVTGVDITRPYLEAARESAEAFGLKAEFLRADMRKFSRPASFDLALNLFRSFGYFDTPEEDRRVLSNIRKSLRPGGAFVLECLGREVAIREFRAEESLEIAGWKVRTSFTVEGDWERVRQDWLAERGDERFGLDFTMRLYSASAMEELFRSVGFDSVEVFGDIFGLPYDDRATNLVVIGRVAGQVGGQTAR